jgi:sRNA-binding protein
MAMPISNRTASMVSRLKSKWPKAFSDPPRPLGVGITASIIAQMNRPYYHKTQEEVSNAMEWWTRQPQYLKSCTVGAIRVNLQGQPVGSVSEAEAQFAAAELVRRAQEEQKTYEA